MTLLARLWHRIQSACWPYKTTSPILSRRQHGLNRNDIDANALKVLYRLHLSGHPAYLVGGGVRDLLLGLRPKDFDVVTDVPPDQLHQLFSNSRLIGRRFRLLHVYFGREVIELSTFRSSDGGENCYGTLQEDVFRRDFTINALYYNIADYSIVDDVGGLADLKRRVIRIIGDPVVRYQEDPVRLLRAMRFAAKLNFKIEAATAEPLPELAYLLTSIPTARLFDEFLKLFFTGHAKATYQQLKRYGYVDSFFPGVSALLQAEKESMGLLNLALEATDVRFADGRSLNPGFLLSVFLWPQLMSRLTEALHEKKYFYHALRYAMDQLFLDQQAVLAIPRRFTGMMRSVWLMQYHLTRRRPSRILATYQQRYFRAAIDLLGLRVEAGEPYGEDYTWWRTFQAADQAGRETMRQALKKKE
jgi:poly(A) polymerase